MTVATRLSSVAADDLLLLSRLLDMAHPDHPPDVQAASRLILAGFVSGIEAGPQDPEPSPALLVNEVLTNW
jgi:hypothetical protein